MSARRQHERAVGRWEADLLSARGSAEAHKLSIVRLESLIKEQQLFIGDLTTQLTAQGDLKRQLGEAGSRAAAQQSELHALGGERDGLQKELQSAWDQTGAATAALSAARTDHATSTAALRAELEACREKLRV